MKGFHKTFLFLFIIIQVILTQGCGGNSNSEGNPNENCSDCEQEKTVIQGRVVDGPLADAKVFIDLNKNGKQDSDEPSATTNEAGFFSVSQSDNTEASIVSIGGTDAVTGIELPNFMLTAELNSDPTKSISVNPLTTLLTQLSDQERQAVSNALAIKEDLETLSTRDHWALAQDNNETAIAVQQVSQQIGLLMLSITTLSETTDAGRLMEANLEAARAMAELADAGNSVPLDLTKTESVSIILNKVSSEIMSNNPLSMDLSDAIAGPIVSFNRILAHKDINPTSELVAQLSRAVQDKLQANITSLISGEMSIGKFKTATRFDNLFSGIELPPGEMTVDTDKDNIPDFIDSDDDNDQELDANDPAPLNRKPTIDITLDINNDKVMLNWEAEDLEDNAIINLYYDTDGSNYDGEKINTANLYEDTDSAYTWNTTWASSGLRSGHYYIYASIDDGKNSPVYAYAEEKVTISRASTISGTPNTSINQGQQYSFKPTVDTDENLRFLATGLPNWMEIHPTTGEVTGKPTKDDIGEHKNIQITVTDILGNSASLPTFDIVVFDITENDAPRITNTPLTSATENVEYRHQVNAEDSDGPQLTYKLQGQPESMQISDTGQITWTPTGDILTSGEVTLIVQDNHPEHPKEASQVFTVNVTLNYYAEISFQDTSGTQDSPYYQLYEDTLLMVEVPVQPRLTSDVIKEAHFSVTNQDNDTIIGDLQFEESSDQPDTTKLYKVRLTSRNLDTDQTYKLKLTIETGLGSTTNEVNLELEKPSRINGLAEISTSGTRISLDDDPDSMLYIYEGICSDPFSDLFFDQNESACPSKTVYNETTGGNLNNDDIYSNTMVLKTGNYLVNVGLPSPLYQSSNHSLVTFKEKLWLFAGEQIWHSADGMSWTQVSKQAPFAPTQAHKAVVFQDQLWVVVGRKGNEYSGEVWNSSDGISWTQVRGHQNSSDGGDLFTNGNLLEIISYNGLMWSFGTCPSQGCEADGDTLEKPIGQIMTSSDGVNWNHFGNTNDISYFIDIQPVIYGDQLWLLGKTLDQDQPITILKLSSNGSWERLTPKPQHKDTLSAAMEGHEVVVFDDKIWVVGNSRCALGNNTTEDSTFDCNQIYHTQDGLNWTSVTTTQNIMSHRGYTSMTEFNGKVWMTGGYHSNHWSEVAYSENGETWTKTNIQSNSFAPRTGHQLVEFNDSMWLIGGSTQPGINSQVASASLKNDVWRSSDGKTWELQLENAPFSARRDHQVTSFDGALWLVGGYDGEYKNDIWKFDGNEWIEFTPGLQFTPIADHQIVVFKGAMWLIGGRVSDDNFNSRIWISSNAIPNPYPHPNPDNSNWYWFPIINLNSDHSGRIRTAHQASTSDDGESFWIFAGTDARGYTVNQSIKIVNSFNIDGINPNYFSPRSGHQVTVSNGRFVLSGGSDSFGEFNEVFYSDDGITWTQDTSVNLPPPRTEHQMLDFKESNSNDSKLWIIGGDTRLDPQNTDPQQPRKVLHDIWVHDNNTNEWTENIRLTAPAPYHSTNP